MQKNNSTHYNWQRIAFVMAAIAAIAVFAGGCGNQTSDHMKTYGHDGYMGYTNTNPNLPNRFGTLNYNVDGNLIEQVLKPIDGIEQTQVIFNGTTVHVNLNVNNKMSDSEVAKLREKAQSVVQYNMPRYNVHVEARR
ncbi:hypothetical protein [Paenibacillus harenae]|uniref:Sporulation protein n=1 Tax=Paenibacillus harenae TaxID=306543 RepID=A0ABT9UD58_PAEHA|nr:hypothetical protein [Paenibacillus harenae]MDQ0116369.1 hypothetical protein [Paenibacillus harenae]